jgi:hypothetical protein
MSPPRYRRARKTRWKIVKWLIPAIAVALVAAGVWAFFYYQPEPPITNTVAIVDQLALYYPNHVFIDNAVNYSKAAGFSADVIQGESVTVDFYKQLPTKGYRLIVLRTHSSSVYRGSSSTQGVFLFTAEPYSETKYVLEQTQGIVKICTTDNKTEYFAIGPEFVRNTALGMKGRFQNTVILITGCQGLNDTRLAEAFIERGASVIVGWDQPVDLTHTDNATTHLLQDIFLKNFTIKQAVDDTMNNVGEDPTYKSRLLFYPNTPEKGAIKIQDLRVDIVMAAVLGCEVHVEEKLWCRVIGSQSF